MPIYRFCVILASIALSTGLAVAQERETRDEPSKAEQNLYEEVYRIGKLGKDGARHVPRLLALLDDKATPKDVRQECLCSISKIGVSAKAAIPSLIRCLREDDSNMRSWALKALRSMGSEAKGVLGKVVECLRDADETVCRQAILASKSIDDKNADVIAELQKVATSSSRSAYTKKLAAESSESSASK